MRSCARAPASRTRRRALKSHRRIKKPATKARLKQRRWRSLLRTGHRSFVRTRRPQRLRRDHHRRSRWSRPRPIQTRCSCRLLRRSHAPRERAGLLYCRSRHRPIRTGRRRRRSLALHRCRSKHQHLPIRTRCLRPHLRRRHALRGVPCLRADTESWSGPTRRTQHWASTHSSRTPESVGRVSSTRDANRRPSRTSRSCPSNAPLSTSSSPVDPTAREWTVSAVQPVAGRYDHRLVETSTKPLRSRHVCFYSKESIKLPCKEERQTYDAYMAMWIVVSSRKCQPN